MLQGIALTAPAGVVTGILGRNGAGKTTLLKSIMGLQATVSGEVSILDRPAIGMGTDAIARLGVAYMPQDARVFPRLSVRENIVVASKAVSRPRPLAETLALLPELEPLLGRTAGTLSGGQQQLVGIARSVSMRCQILLMDEPTEGLMPSLVARSRQHHPPSGGGRGRRGARGAEHWPRHTCLRSCLRYGKGRHEVARSSLGTGPGRHSRPLYGRRRLGPSTIKGGLEGCASAFSASA